MEHVVRATELRQQLKTMFDRVADEKQILIVTRHHQPEVVLIPYEECVRFWELSESQTLAQAAELEVVEDK